MYISNLQIVFLQFTLKPHVATRLSKLVCPEEKPILRQTRDVITFDGKHTLNSQEKTSSTHLIDDRYFKPK
jgi:hypothetical protein